MFCHFKPRRIAQEGKSVCVCVCEAAVNKKLASCWRQECGRLCGRSGNAALHLERGRSQTLVRSLVHGGSTLVFAPPLPHTLRTRVGEED